MTNFPEDRALALDCADLTSLIEREEEPLYAMTDAILGDAEERRWRLVAIDGVRAHYIGRVVGACRTRVCSAQ